MMKKSLSLILALALVLGMTVFAQSTEVYFSLDVDDYASAESLINSFTSVTSTINNGSFDGSGTGTFLAESRTVQDVENATGGLYKSSTNFTTATTVFDTNTAGKKSLLTANSSTAYNANAAIAFVPKKSWNFIDNPDEIYIISYDVDINPRGAQVQLYHTDRTLWTDDDKSVNLDMNVFHKTSSTSKTISFAANAGRVFSSSAISATFSPGKTYRVAYGYAYGDGNLKEDNRKTPPEPYYVPTRLYFRDGGPWNTSNGKYSSTLDYGEGKNASNQTIATHSWNGKPVIYAFTLGWQGEYGMEYADILAYTVSSDPSTFTAEMVEDAIELGDSAVVKFSQPIAPSTATKEAFTMTEDGNEYTAFEIGEVDTVVDDDTGEVYSTVEFIFPYGQKADTEYVININSSVKSEIMRTVADGNELTFTTGSTPDNIVTLSAKSGLSGDGADMTNISTSQAKFTAVATESEKPAFLFVGIFEGDTLVSYTYTLATTGDVLSLATKVEAGQTVKAFSCGSVYDLSEVFGTPGTPIN